MGMDFPMVDLMDEDACYSFLVSVLHPDDLACPKCGGRNGGGTEFKVYRCNRAPVLDYQCRSCGRVFNAFTQTALAGTHRRPSQLVLILRGVAKGEPTAALARELKCSRAHLLELRHKLQANAAEALIRADPALLTNDKAVEADEMYQAAGEKRDSAFGSGRPAAAARQQATRTRHMGQRPPADSGRGRPRHRKTAARGRASQHTI
jgi:transposase-like protein